MGESRDATELLNNPAVPEVGEMPDTMPETPYGMAFNLLSSLGGEKLEIMTRSNPRLVQAAQVSYCMVAQFGSSYIAGENDQLERFAVSLGGEGRKEIVESLRAGGDMPDAFYEAQSGGTRGPPRTFTDAVDEDED